MLGSGIFEPSPLASQETYCLECFRVIEGLCVCVCVCMLVAQSRLTPCNPMDWLPTRLLVPGIFQARVVEGVAIPFSRESSRPRHGTQVSCIAGRLFTV